MRALTFALALSLAASLGCANPVVSVNVSVVTTACSGALQFDPQRNPTENVDTLRFTLSGDGLTPMTINSAFSSGGARIPNVSLGTNRRITAEALVSGTGLVRARADSGAFDVTADSQPQVTLFLRVIDAFVLTGSNSGVGCTHLSTPRAGHQMTLLSDGKVLISGGYSIDGAGALHYLTQAEIYDPALGTFSPVAVNAAVGRAGHAAFPVTVDGFAQVLLFGGEGPGASGTPGPAGAFELYNAGSFSTVPLGSTVPARERAATALDVKNGFPIIAGGTNGPDVPNASVTVYDSVSYFNPQQNTVLEVDEPLRQAISDAVGVSRKNIVTGGSPRGGMVIIGGRDSMGNASAQISGIINQSGHTYVADMTYELPALAALPAPRVHHSAVVANDDTIVVLGGTTAADTTYASATDAVTVVAPDQVAVVNATQVLAQARGDGCAVVLESGDVIYAGGAFGDSGGLHSTSAVDIVSPAGQASTVRALEGPSAGGNWSLQASRHKAACLRLADGTVLITGGLQYQSSGPPIALGSAEIYTPPSP